MQQLLILSDIHGNVSALESIMKDVDANYSPDAAVILGDNIDYCMRSNEVLKILKEFKVPIIASLWGNHEYAIINEDYNHFSSQRGVASAKHTRRSLAEESLEYISGIEGKQGKLEFCYGNKLFLAVHGNLQNPFWGTISVKDNFQEYEKYDYVLSGHSHIAHYFSAFNETNNSRMRNKKRTVFINPGSVGQPRNHDPNAQYAILDLSCGVTMRSIEYDVKFEQSLFTDEVDLFYRERLENGV